ncbi:hypothetical protein LEP1GSC060_1094 [Leptospira weilii serovar Ranarum str. ICFT]|uniref:Alpha/beta hydrolase family protein n=1 Tax=Leptospira weilii serovar Ranarum str. ICFT TaxID=1218598 RepID=N1WFI4_9LEPT|nr:hypothetical protein [Leptospira weilii]EMY79001.1 hypothetical protein LEP1GSC060_1094 [Leptospira weilii serovar Ranarum str. ICFT]
MSDLIRIVRFETENTNPLILIPDLPFSERKLYADSFLSSYSVRVFELPANWMGFGFPKFEDCIDLLSREILNSKRKVKLIGEGLFSGMVFELLKKIPQAIEAACVLDPPLFRTDANWMPKNAEWILERFPPWLLLSRELHSFYESLEQSLRSGFTDSKYLPAIVFTKHSGKITKQIQIFGETIQRFPVFRIETSRPESVQNLLKNLILKILAEVPISSVQKKSKFKIEPGF